MQIIKNRTIVVDLDNSLIKIDIYLESLGRSLFVSPVIFFKTIYILLFNGGIGASKTYLAENFKINLKNIPFNESVISYLKCCKKKDCKIILSSGSSEIYVSQISSNLGIFSNFHGSNKNFNNVGLNKLNLLLEKYGENFIYVGDSKKDYVIWEKCKSAIIVGNNKLNKLDNNVNIIKKFKRNESKLKSIFKQLRIHQWTKNILVFIPSILNYNIFKPEIIFFNLKIFISFSLIASCMYILNDINDVESDRNHYKKSKRPIASGNLPVITGYLLIAILGVTGMTLAYQTNIILMNIMLLYIVINCFYSFILKKVFLLDIIILTSFYCLRVYTGSLHEEIPFSMWLMSFTLFIFFNLSLLKRFTDLIDLKNKLLSKIDGRVYMQKDIKIIKILGYISTIFALLTLSLYILSDQVLKIYDNSYLLFFIIPILMFWNLRIWRFASKSKLDSDPVVFVIRDKFSYVIGITILIVLFFARYSYL